MQPNDSLHQSVDREAALSATVALIKALLPDFRQILRDLRESHGYISFPDQLCLFLSKNETSGWSSLYENPDTIRALCLASLIGKDGVMELAEKLRDSSVDAQIQVREMLKAEVLSGEFDSQFEVDQTTIDKARQEFENLDPSDQADAIQHVCIVLYSVITQFHHYLALMSFGTSQCDLVRMAKAGDDSAFFKAVQVDKTVLFGIPYFRQRLTKAQLSGESDFMDKLAKAVQGKPLGSKIRYKTLMMVFAVLDDEGFLDMPLDQLMNICEDIGVYGREYGVEDVDSLRKRVQYYRSMTGRQIAF